MPANKYYFAYYAFKGATCVAKLVGIPSTNGKPAEFLAKYEITEEEFKLHWEVLMRKYPFND